MNLRKRKIIISSNHQGIACAYDIEKKQFYTYKRPGLSPEEMKKKKLSSKQIFLSVISYPLFMIFVLLIEILGLNVVELLQNMAIITSTASLIVGYFLGNFLLNREEEKYIKVISYDEIDDLYIKDAITHLIRLMIISVCFLLLSVLILVFLEYMTSIEWVLIIYVLLITSCIVSGMNASHLNVVGKLKLYKKLKKERGEHL
ncbi:MAG: hypothetical protein ACK5LZ_03130 [Anaerorhabdus sp.]